MSTDNNTSGIATALRTAQTAVEERYSECEEAVREAPGISLLCAVGVGYFFRILPLTGIVGGLMRVVIALIRPAILIFGAAKLYEFLQRQSASSSR